MRLKLYRAGTVAEAMSQVRTELGSEALILSTRRVGGGVELTAALDRDDEPPPKPPPQTRPALQWHGVPENIATRLTTGELSHTLAELLHFGRLPLEPPADAGAALLLTGVPGAGKTLTTARLATRYVMAGRKPLVITADGRRAGAAEELSAYTRLLGINLLVASHPATLARAMQHRTEGSPVLIDTAGVNPFDAAQMEAIAALTAIAEATPALVMAAGADAQEAAEQAACFAAAGVRHLIPTRLDVARRLGSIVTAAVSGNFCLSEAGTGPGATDGLTALTAPFLAARLCQMPAPRLVPERKQPGSRQNVW